MTKKELLMKEFKDSANKVSAYLSILTPREQKVLKLRLGLEDGIRYTLEEVGQEFGVTRERIRQMEAKAIEKVMEFRKDLTKR